MNPVKAFTLVALGLAIAAIGVYGASADDAPGAAVVGMLLMVIGVVLGVRAARTWLPLWAARTALAVGVVSAAFAAFLIHGVVVTAPLFAQPQEVPSVVDSALSAQHAAAIGRAREIVRAAILEQNLPGVSVAVGIGLPSGALAEEGGTLVWAEGFGWRDVVTQTPVTPHTRFNIGTAAAAVSAAVAPLGLTDTGADAAKAWSPEAIGEEGEDFPPLAFLRHAIWQPLGLMPAEHPLPGERATFYVPRSEDNDPRRGRRLVYARPGLLRTRDGVLFHAVRSRALRAGDGLRQRRRRARRRPGDVADGGARQRHRRRGHVQHGARGHVLAGAASRGRVCGTDAMIAPVRDW